MSALNSPRVLLLGGTSEARALAAALAERGESFVSSLAGRVRDPALPVGDVRIGGFGGLAGLVNYLVTNQVTDIVDATHPFAATISAHAAAAADQAGVRLLRLVRPGWSDHPRAAEWTWVADLDAARSAAEPYRRPFLTTGRQSLAAFLTWADRPVVARVVDPPELALPARWTLIRSRGPYDLAGERSLMDEYGIDALLTKDSGGQLTSAKLDAATQLGIPVIVVARPPVDADVPELPTVAEVLARLG